MMSSLLSGRWLPLVINTVLQSLFVLAAAALGLLCTRKASASRRHLVSVVALVVLVLIPVMSLVIPAPKPLVQVSGPGLTLRRSPVRTLSASARTEPDGTAAAVPRSASVPTHTTTPSLPVSPSSPGVIFSTEAAAGVGSPVVSSVSLSRFAPWLAAFWLIGALAVLGRLLVGLDRIRRIARQSKAVLPEALHTQIRVLLSEAGFVRPISILRASSRNPVSVAMTWGVWKATLLLPAEAAQWPAERLRVVLLHELAHIRRHDWLTQMFGQIVCALYWFHPLVWLLNRHTQIEAEHACDDAVLVAGVRAKEYAAHLLEVVKAMQAGRNAPSAAVAMARPTQVRYRLEAILNAQRSRQTATRSVLTLVLSVTGLLLCAISLLRPLAWASGHQQPSDPKRFPAIGPVVNLPNGISVELVAIGSEPDGFGDDWWTPNGKPVLELPREQALPFASREYGFPERLLRRALFFRLHMDPHVNQGVDFSTTGYVVDPTQHLQTALYRYGRNDRGEGYILPPRATVGTVLLGFPHTETHCTYRIGIATGPWETITTTRLTPQPTPDAISILANAIPNQTRLVQNDMPHLSYQDPRGKEHTLSLLGDHVPLGDVAKRIVALDRDDQELSLGTESYDNKTDSRQVPAWAQSHIVKLRLQIRSYQWAEFKDILLEHALTRKPIPISPPHALPAFRHTFACGITLKVPAVTESRKEGGLWWKPDGTLLTGPVKGYEYMMGNFTSWQHRVRPRALILQLTSSRPLILAYSSAVRFVPSVPDESDDMLPGNESVIGKNQLFPSGALHDFPPDLPYATLRYGIAAGAWRTAAAVAMPTDVQHAGPTGDPDQGGVMLQVPGYPTAGDMPKLLYTTVAGRYRDIPFKILDTAYLHDVARRFVAVDRAGHIFPLRSNNGSQETLDKAGKPIPLDPANAGKTNLVVGDYLRREVDVVNLSFGDTGWMHGANPIDLTHIREIRMEIRPYEWAELHHIALQPAKGGAAR